MKFAIFDAANLFNRAHHVVQGDAFTRAGMALHIVFNSIKKVYHQHDIDHIVIAGEGRSWRYDYYPEYKAKRILDRQLQSAKEREDQQVYRDVLENLMDFFKNKTRMTVLQSQGCEGDDLIARWVQLHPDDEHVIISGDSDNIQLLTDKVSIYDGINDRLITRSGIFDSKNQPMVFEVNTSNGKIKVKGTIQEEANRLRTANRALLKEAKEAEKSAEKEYKRSSNLHGAESTQAELTHKALTVAKLNVLKEQSRSNEVEWEPEENWPEKALFLKIIRGDVGDGIFSANPGVRYKGSKKSIGIEDAWNDRHNRGFEWNNFMLRRWNKLVGDTTVEVTVRDEYEKNQHLIDLSKQPQEIIELMDRVIVEAVQKPEIRHVGIEFARFCKTHELNRLSIEAQDFAKMLGAPYGK